MKQKITLIFVLSIYSFSLFSTNFTVTNNADIGLGSLRQAIMDANADVNTPHTILFNGSYVITLSSALQTLTKSITIDGQSNTINITGFSSSLTSISNTAALTLKNLTFNSLISSYSAIVYATNCTYKNTVNAVKVNATTFSATHCTFDNNSGSATLGASVTTLSSSAIVQLSGCTITNNTGVPAIYHKGQGTGTLTITNCIISGNTSTAGPAIYNYGNGSGSSLSISNSIISGNTNTSTTIFGGGIGSGAATTIANCQISGNRASRGGGIALLIGGSTASSSLTMTASTVSGNSLGQYVASAYGGGVYIQGSTANYTGNCTFTNCTISGNSTPVIGGVTTSASSGGGLEIGGGGNSTWAPTITFTNCTITGNTVQGNQTGNVLTGGGIDKANGTVVLNYCIVAGNNSNSSSASRDIGSVTSTTGRNLFGGTPNWNSTTTTGNVNLTSDISTILNNTLADNGGTTTLPDGSYVKTHALVLGCAAINPDANGVSGLQTMDQRGFTRDATPDMGAIEFTLLSTPIINSLTPGDSKITVNFSHQNSIQENIVNYKYSTDAGATYTECYPAQTVGPIEISGLNNSSWYSIRIKAITADNESSDSNVLTAILSSNNNALPTYVVLLAGQSNMAGRGIIRLPMDTVTYANVLSLNKDTIWVTAKNPVHYDKPEAAVGMAITFATNLAKLFDNNVRIALVPCAAGGTSISQWLSDYQFTTATASFKLYTNLISRAKTAQKTGKIIGLLWHQGEADGGVSLNTNYQSNLHDLFNRIRTDLNEPNLPIIAGELGKYFDLPNSACVNADSISRYTKKLKTIINNFDVAGSESLTPNSDNVHFTAASQVIFGQRYAELFNGQMTKMSVLDLTVNNNQDFDVPINIEEYIPISIYKYSFTFNYNPVLFNYIGYSLPDGFNANGNLSVSVDVPGKLLVSWSSATPFSTTSPILKIKFHSLNNGDSSFSIQDIKINHATVNQALTSKISVSQTTSVTLSQANIVNMYFNDKRKKIFFSGVKQPFSITLTDFSGRIINNYKLGTDFLDLSYLSQGIYICSLKTEMTHTVLKFII